MQMLIRCRNCKVIHHETTEHYRNDMPVQGRMLRLIEPWKGYGWPEFSPYDTWDALQCPNCGAPIPGQDGRVRPISAETPAVAPLVSPPVEKSVLQDPKFAQPEPVPPTGEGTASPGAVQEPSENTSRSDLGSPGHSCKQQNGSGQTVYVCPDCGKGCRTMAGLVNHRRIAHAHG